MNRAKGKAKPKTLNRVLLLFSLLIGFLVFLPASLRAAQEVPASMSPAVRAMEQAAGGPVKVTVSPATRTPSFIRAGAQRGIPAGLPASAKADDRAKAFLQSHGKPLGLPGPGEVTVLQAGGLDEVGMEHVRLQQVHEGIPVRGGQMMVHLRGASVVSVHAKTLPGIEGINKVPSVAASDALPVARAMVAEHYGVDPEKLSPPRLEIFSRALLAGKQAPTRLAWFIEARGPRLHVFVWVDAHTGEGLFHLNRITHLLNREIRIPDPELPWWEPGPIVRVEGDPPTGDPEIDNAYDYTGDTYNYFFNEHGRDSYDGMGATMTTVVHDPGKNAQFSYEGFVLLGEGFATDDVVGHEWTHGVVYTTVDFATLQGGILNESYADIFGETIDLTNGAGIDTPDVRWTSGEELPPDIQPRNMMNPAAYGFPGKMSDRDLFSCTAWDAHTNSCVPSHAYALLVDGGTYNGYTINGIGLTKAGKIYFRTLTLYLLQASDFTNNYMALQQSCSDLIGTAGITEEDCTELKKALDAVEMYFPWPCNCGDGWVDGEYREECDDGNLEDGDGCDSSCRIEPCFACSGTPSSCTCQVGTTCGLVCSTATVCQETSGQCTCALP